MTEWHRPRISRKYSSPYPSVYSQVTVQELQDDEVQFAVFRGSQMVDMSHVAQLDDKTFPKFIDGPLLVVVLFTVRCEYLKCRRCLSHYV